MSLTEEDNRRIAEALGRGRKEGDQR